MQSNPNTFNQIYGYACTRCGQYVQNMLGGHICPSYQWPWTTQTPTPQPLTLDYVKLADMVADHALRKLAEADAFASQVLTRQFPDPPEVTSRDVGAE